MSEIIISTGKNLNEAIDSGLVLMKLTKSQVDIEIIQNEDKKYFGLFGTRQAVVRIIKKSLINNGDTEHQVLKLDVPMFQLDSDSQEPLRNLDHGQSHTDSEFGKVWVKEGQIYYKETSTHYPTINPPTGVVLYKNGVLIRTTTALMEKDLLKFEFQNELKELSWSISLDPLEIVATLQIEPGYRKTYRLVDQEPSSHCQLEIQLHEEKMINNLQLTQIEQRMKELGINTRIQRLEIQRALETTKPGVFTIAKGIEPMNGVDGWIEFVVNNEFKENCPKELENGDVGYRELVTIPHVDKGQLLANINHPKSEKIGITVTGKRISPNPPKQLIVHAHRGVNLIDQGTKIVAVKSGRPIIQIKDSIAKISVIPKLIQSIDGDLSSSNLQYIGDIEIQGNVNEGMKVVAMMDINISGTVYKSNITAGNRMVVRRDVVNSILSSGKINQLNERLGILLGRLSIELISFVSAIEQVYQSPAFKTSDIAKMGLSSLIRILLEKKFMNLPPLINELSALILKADKLQILDSEFQEIHCELINGFLKVSPTQFRKPENIVSLVEQIEEVYELISISQESGAHMEISYALNSELYCSGDISIVGKGCINSNIYSGGKVLIQGVLRGGEVFATMGIEAEKTGSKEGAITRIIVPVGQTIKINNAMKDTIIQIGSHSHKFLRSEQNIFARVNLEGQLLLF